MQARARACSGAGVRQGGRRIGTFVPSPVPLPISNFLPMPGAWHQGAHLSHAPGTHMSSSPAPPQVTDEKTKATAVGEGPDSRLTLSAALT